MQEAIYAVVLFHRQDGKLMDMAPLQAESEIAAVGEAQRLVQEAAGAIVIGRLVDSRTGQRDGYEIIFRTGDVPDAFTNFRLR